MELRPYQTQALTSLGKHLANGTKSPLVCLPTGSGKTPVICKLLQALSNKFPSERFVCAVHTQELVGQLAGTYERITGERPAVYSASLKRKEFGRIIFGQIQSLYKQACKVGRIKVLVIDECDRIPLDGDGQYRTFLADSRLINPDLRLCGFTATPYRTTTGLIYGKDRPFESLVYDADIRQLIDAGYLSSLVSKDGGRPDLEGVKVQGGDYVANQLEEAMSDEVVVRKSVDEIVRYGANRKAWLIFASGIKHANLIRNALLARGVDAPIIEGNTPDDERKQKIEAYRNKKLKCLININVLSVGFDAPHVDMLCLMRPTLSPGLYYQQVGRGLRIAEGKSNCLVLDLAGNVSVHGPIDTLNKRIKSKAHKPGEGEAPTKTCENCKEIVPAGLRVCSACGTEFPPPKIAKHDTVASNRSPLSETQELSVTSVNYLVHRSKSKDKPNTLLVTYHNGLLEVCRQYLSVNPNGNEWAYDKTLHFLADTPKLVVGDRSLTIECGVIVGQLGNERVAIGTAEAMLPFAVCLAKPIRLMVRPNAKNPQYTDVLRRTFKESNEQVR